MEDNNIIPQSNESIKLIKNSKGYNWEIKLIDDENIENQIKRLEKIDKELREKYEDNIKLKEITESASRSEFIKNEGDKKK